MLSSETSRLRGLYLTAICSHQLVSPNLFYFDSLTWAPNLSALVPERCDSDDLVPLELLAAAVVPPDADERAAAVALAGVLTFKQSCPSLNDRTDSNSKYDLYIIWVVWTQFKMDFSLSLYSPPPPAHR